MHICKNILSLVALAVLLLSAAFSAIADDVARMSDAKPSPAAKSANNAAAQPERQLSQEQLALRDQVRQILAVYRQSAFNTQQNTATEIQSVCLAYGCESEVSLADAEGRRINGITVLCWNYPCNGFEMLAYRQKHIAARIGYGYQENPGEFLAVLAMSRVSAGYPVRVGKDVRKVADIVTAEKLACRAGGDASLRLIGLSYYADEPQWKNDLDETWSIERIIGEELKRPAAVGSEAGLNRLLGLSYAVARQLRHTPTLEGQFQRAQKYMADFIDFALRLQNADGTWGPAFLAARSEGADVASQLRGTGRVLEWLAISLPDGKLQNQQIVAAVEAVTRLLGNEQYQGLAPSLSTRDIVSLGHALHALSIYDERVFKPFDAPEKPADKQASAQREFVR